MSTYISGVASCSAIDTAGEIVDISGLDITSLARSGTCNWEHKADTPAQTVGKILKAKKIFSEKDCEDSNQKHFWDKTKLPFVYIVAELLDDYTASAKECAGQMRYSKDHPELSAILGFSVEGSEIPGTRKNSMLITRSIARKVTLTVSPANKLCIAQIFENPEQKSQVKDDFEELFRSDQEAITLFKSGEGEKIYESYLAKKEHEPKKPCKHKKMKKDEFGYPDSPKTSAPPPEPNKANAQAMQNGAESGGPSFSQGLSNLANGLMGKSENFGWSKGKVDKDKKAVHYEHPTHGTVSVIRHDNGDFHVKHRGALAGVGGVKGSFPTSGEAGTHAKKYMSSLSQGKTLAPQMHNISSTDVASKKHLKKAIDAGSYNAAPSTLASGAAYQRESLGSKPATTGAEDHNFQGTKKKDWNKRSKEDYENWPQKEKFEKFMSARMPHLALGEIKALGRAICLKKNIEAEKALGNLVLGKSEEDPKLGNHFLFSAENPMHPHKNESRMDHKQTLVHLKSKGFDANEVKGHYGAPETSIMVHNVNPKQAEHLHGIASKLGQDSSIYSNNGKHEMRYHHGEKAGKSHLGSGTEFHKEKPKDFYTTLPNGKHFTHNFDFDQLHNSKKKK